MIEVNFLGVTSTDHEFRAMGHLAAKLAQHLKGLICSEHERRPTVNIYCESGQLQFEIEGCCPALIASAEARVVPTAATEAEVRRIA